MQRILLITWALLLMSSFSDARGYESNPSSMDVSSATTAIEQINQLIHGDLNHQQPYIFDIDVQTTDTMRRNVPMLEARIPWSDAPLRIEVPEYTWAKIEGDERNEQPFFYGREIGMIPDWKVRYPQLDIPVWKRLENGSIALDAALEGGYIQHFRVIPGDRYIQVWFGISNNSTKPMQDVWVQLCMMTWRVGGLAERSPLSSHFLVDSKLSSWDSDGQDLTWIENFRSPENGEEFSASVFFSAQTEPYFWQPEQPDGQLRADFMVLTCSVDLPAIAKNDQNSPDQNLFIYSPSGRGVFFNCLVPCFHADPHIDVINPGETRWTVSYYVLFKGDAVQFLRRLEEIHQRLEVKNGYLMSDPMEDIEDLNSLK